MNEEIMNKSVIAYSTDDEGEAHKLITGLQNKSTLKLTQTDGNKTYDANILVSIFDLHKSYDSNPVIKNFSLEI